MNVKKRIKQDVSSRMDEAFGLEETPKKGSILPKVLIPIGSLMLIGGLVAGGVAVSLRNALPASLGEGVHLTAKRDALPRDEQKVSKRSAEIYREFYVNSASAIFAESKAESKSYSPFDAFVNFAALAYFSEGPVSSSLLNLFGEPSKDELATAVYELTYALGTPTLIEGKQAYIDGQFKEVHIEDGGYSANSLWTGGLPMREDANGKRAQKDMTERFLASILTAIPTSEGIADWLKSVLPEGYEIPEIKIGKDTEAAFVSSYFLKVANPKSDYDYALYQRGDHKIDYHLFGETLQCDYIYESLTDAIGTYFISDDLIGGSNSAMGLSTYMPLDENATPHDIIDKVIIREYQTKKAAPYQTSIPYFTVEESLDLLSSVYDKYASSRVGVMSAIMSDEMELIAMKQTSKVNFDYDGFYSSSVTISEMTETSAWVLDDSFAMVVDRPFVFEKNRVLYFEEGGAEVVPVVLGVIYDPAYQRK